jgi:hypothetical protein
MGQPAVAFFEKLPDALPEPRYETIHVAFPRADRHRAALDGDPKAQETRPVKDVPDADPAPAEEAGIISGRSEDLVQGPDPGLSDQVVPFPGGPPR